MGWKWAETNALCALSPLAWSLPAGTIPPAPLPLGFLPHPVNLSLSAFAGEATGSSWFRAACSDLRQLLFNLRGLRWIYSFFSSWLYMMNKSDYVPSEREQEAWETVWGLKTRSLCVGCVENKIPDFHLTPPTKDDTLEAPPRCDS